MTDPVRPAPSPARAAPILAIVAGVVALVFTVARVRHAMTEPLWFDETFSLAIVSAPDWASFWREVWLDSNAPAYYTLLRLWTGLFGDTDLALRLPGLISILAAGALPLLVPLRGLGREARLTWAALIFAWWGIGYFLDARCYALLLAVSTAQALAFARLMDRPGPRTAWTWAAIAACAILTHYYALFIGLAQGLIYLWRRRLAALRTWPAALAFVPAFAWIVHHAPRLADYSRLGKVWHPPLDADAALGLFAYVFGATDPTTLPAAAAILAVGLILGRTARANAPRRSEAEPASQLPWVAAAGALAFLMILAFGATGAGLSPRYLISLAPSALLGVVLAAQATGRPRLTCAALVLVYCGLQAKPAIEALSPPRPQTRYEFQTGSAFLMDHGVSDLTFLWDHELTSIMAPGTLEQVGGVFFARAHRPLRVHPFVARPGQDPNPALIAAAQGPRPGLVWLFSREGHTAAHDFPPAIGRLDPRWACSEVGDGTIGALACYRR